MPEIRFTDDELRLIQQEQQEAVDTFEAIFGRFRQWLDDSDMELVKVHRLAIVRRDAFFRLSLRAAAESLTEVGLLDKDEVETFVEGGFDASIDYSSDPMDLFEPPRELWVKLKLTPREEERRAEIRSELLERYGIIGPTKLVVVGEISPGQVAIDAGEFSREMDAALEREGLEYREDALGELLCMERGR
jgi:hypothetical protein